MAVFGEMQAGMPHMFSDAFDTLICGDTPVFLFCDHASNHVPDDVADGELGLSAQDMARHIAYDIGAKGLTEMLAKALGAQAIFSKVSRLVIDPNRGEDDPTLIMQLYDGSLIPGNRHLDAAQRAYRVTRYHRPYHAQADAMLDAMIARQSRTPIIFSIHSFTPQLQGRPPRPWHVGVLYADDRRLADPMMAALAEQSDIVVGDNEPYSGKLTNDCMATHGISRGLPHVLIEVRNDLIETEAGQAIWAKRLSPVLSRVMNDHWEKEPDDHG